MNHAPHGVYVAILHCREGADEYYDNVDAEAFDERGEPLIVDPAGTTALVHPGDVRGCVDWCWERRHERREGERRTGDREPMA